MPISRLIQVKARDARNQPLLGASFEWTEDGAARGRIENSDGHATLRATSQTSIVEVVATYGGIQMRLKLAPNQNSCDFHFSGVNKSRLEGWSNSTVLGALIAAIAAVIVGYWQFVYKDESKETDVYILVKDRETQTPIPGATVTIEGAGSPSPVFSDGEGRAVFKLKKSKTPSLTVTARAKGYSNGASTISDFEAPVLVPLQALKAPVSQQHASGAVRTASPSAPVNGTWRVLLEGNLVLKRVRSGSVELERAAGGRIGISARLNIDGDAVKLRGEASRRNNVLFLDYVAEDENTVWNGMGELTIGSARLEGFMTDKKGKEVPLTLEKI